MRSKANATEPAMTLAGAAKVSAVFLVRRDNLRLLLQRQEGGKTALAKKLGYASASFISQMCGPNPSRPITETTARSIEARLGLEAGWMDEPHDALGAPAPPVATVFDDLLSECLQAVLTALQLKRRPASADKVTMLVNLLYEHARAHGGHVDSAHLDKLISLT